MRRLLVCAAAAAADAAAPLPALAPVGRTYYSTDPEASAAYFAASFGGATEPANLTAARPRPAAGCAAAAVRVPVPQSGANRPAERLTSKLLTFVRDDRKPAGAGPAPAEAAACAERWMAAAANGSAAYSRWEDHHDGHFISPAMDAGEVIRASPTQFYWDNKFPAGESPKAVLRPYVPGTRWTVEYAGDQTALTPAQRAALDAVAVPDPDNCRNNSADDPSLAFKLGWWKATYGVPDPATTAEFAVRFLGAVRVPAPYPAHAPPGSKCTEAAWVQFRPLGFFLHFVQSHEWPAACGGVTPEGAAAGIDALRGGGNGTFARGVFDRWAYDALTLWAEDLDPFVARLRAAAAPFIVRGWPAAGVAGLFVAAPGGLTFELRSRHLTAAAVEPWDLCGPR